MGRSLARASAFLAFWLLRAAAQQREVPPLQQTIKTPSLDADVTNPTGEAPSLTNAIVMIGTHS